MLPLILRDLVFLGHVEGIHPMSGLANGGPVRGRSSSSQWCSSALLAPYKRYDEVER